MIKLVSTATGLSFPEFEDGARLSLLIRQIAAALGTSPRDPGGSPLEVLVGFQDYPEELALWWDGFTCELGCSGPCSVTLDEVSERLLSSGLFTKV